MGWISLLLVGNQAIAIFDHWEKLVDMEKIVQAIVGFISLKLLERNTLDLIISDLQLEIANANEDPELN